MANSSRVSNDKADVQMSGGELENWSKSSSGSGSGSGSRGRGRGMNMDQRRGYGVLGPFVLRGLVVVLVVVVVVIGLSKDRPGWFA